MWKSYFEKLLNENHTGNIILEESGNNREIWESIFFCRIRASEVIFTLKKMKSGRALGPDSIPIEAWKCLGDVGVSWSTKIFNKIIITKKMPDKWRKSILYIKIREIYKIAQITRVLSLCDILWSFGKSNRAEVKTWNKNIKESIWLYAWEVDNGSDLFIKETNGKVSR